jgi:hypothetical protein
MAVADLLKDTRLVSTSKDANLRGLTKDWVLRRIRMLVQLNPTSADPSRPGDITAAATIALGDLIARDLPKVAVASDTILKRIAADTAHLSLDPAIRRKRGTKLPPLPLKDARANRQRLVRTIVYQAAADNITLVDPVNIDRLHLLVDRRLRVVERMVYDVGRAGPRAWNVPQIAAHRGGPWLDGYERLFEYPRVPTWAFLGACNLTSMRRCSAPMDAWGHPAGDVNLSSNIAPNKAGRDVWTVKDTYELDFDPSKGVPAVTAIQRLFTPQTDFQARNLLYCDHVIHALHLEALEFSRTKRNVGTAWLDAEVASHPARWLRVHAQFDKPGPYLGDLQKSVFFEHLNVRESDLQVGDHLIIFNHPAYRRAAVDGVWQLENAVVVQTFPELLMQGHGSPLLNKGGMWDVMIDLFHTELKRRRADVLGLCKVLGFGNNTVTVNDLRFLSRGMRVDIVRDDLGEAVLAADRTIVSIAGATVRYDGPSVSATTAHRLRRARKKLFDQGLDGIEENFLLARRVTPSASQYAPGFQHADWFIAWVVKDKDEEKELAIRTDPVRAAFVKERHLIEYTQERIGNKPQTVGWFPLWKPSKKGKTERLKNGKITAIEEVRVQQRDVSGWTWFFDPDPKKRDRVPVIRPREL